MSLLLGLFGPLKLLTLFGGGAMGWIARHFAWHTKVAAVAKQTPRWAWIALAVVIVLVGSYFFHKHEVHKFKVEVQRAQMAVDNDYWKQKLAVAHADAVTWRHQYETAQTTIANQERSQHEEAVRNNAAIASALLVRGPGKAGANCGPVNSAGSSTGSSGREPTPSPNEIAGSEVPASDWATVSWRWLVQVVTEHDDSVSENRAWRDQHAKQLELHAQQTAPVQR